MSSHYKPITKEDAIEIIRTIDVFLLTATDVETISLHQQLTPIDLNILKVGIDSYTYYIAKFGNYLVLHTQCKAGSASFGGSSVVTSHAIALCKPKAIIMIGIAFGIDPEKQKIGDVLISESLWPYDIQKIGKNGSVHRGGNPRASGYLLNRFKDATWSYDFKIGNGKKTYTSKAKQGILFSGEKLVDKLEFREQLKKEVPEAIGGEMEGAGLVVAAEASKTDWIVVKAICDFADGNKSKNKQAYQNAAAAAAVVFCKYILSEEHVLAELGVEKKQHEIAPTHADPHIVLFRKYSNEAEPYYYERQIDHWFNGYLKNYSIWLHGDSGSGKSTVISRNLQQSGYQIIQICLASGTDYDINSILNEIWVRMRIHFNVPSPKSLAATTDQLIESISNLIIDKFDFKQQIIYLDEIPEYKSKETFDAFFQSIYAININVLNAVPTAQFVFVLSSITSPLQFIHNSQQKVLESFKFSHMKIWSDKEITALMNLIIDALKPNLSNEEIEKIKKASKGSPRSLKRVMRDYFSTMDSSYITLDRIISEIEAEI